MTMTITEALAELGVIDKKRTTQQSFIAQYTVRPDFQKDPLLKDGGSDKAVAQRFQSIRDLDERYIAIRAKIAASNQVITITLNGVTRSVADWLVWRRDIADKQLEFYRGLAAGIARARTQAQQKGGALVSASATTADTKPADIITNVDEGQLQRDIEDLEAIKGTLDGQLSLKNATVSIDV